MNWYYLLALLLSIGGLITIDHRLRLAFWHDSGAAAKTIAVSVVIFIIWDICGIALGIFRNGGSMYMLPYELFPEFPIEEIFFLCLLTYTTLLIHVGLRRWRHI